MEKVVSLWERVCLKCANVKSVCVCVPRGRKYNYKSVCDRGGEGGSRLSVNMRGGREGEEERMMGDKKETGHFSCLLVGVDHDIEQALFFITNLMRSSQQRPPLRRWGASISIVRLIESEVWPWKSFEAVMWFSAGLMYQFRKFWGWNSCLIDVSGDIFHNAQRIFSGGQIWTACRQTQPMQWDLSYSHVGF